MIRSVSFNVLTHFFQFNKLKILRQPGYLIFFKLNHFLQCKDIQQVHLTRSALYEHKLSELGSLSRVT